MKTIAAALVLVAVGVSACGSSSTDTKTTTPAASPSKDKLAQIKARGTLILFTDPKYPPQSFAVKGAKRPASTKCAANQLTAPEITGYDAESGKLVAKGLGVEP